MDLTTMMNDGIGRISATVSRYYLKNTKGLQFLSKFIPELKKSAKKRRMHEANGLHVPAFLIASIASRCNLHCSGCYARAEGMCGDGSTAKELDADEWHRVFEEASALGIPFILLAGGEPLIRRDVLTAAAKMPSIVFPVFTNGILLEDDTFDLFDAHRNLIPVISMEGSDAQTDERRGDGVAKRIRTVMTRLLSRRMLYAVSITVTRENMETVTGAAFLQDLHEQGCGIVFYVEYVPIQPGTDALVLTEDDIDCLELRVAERKRAFGDMTILSFPGDEQSMGGCLAAGRGFFHINPVGGAEPCPFSPYSTLNVRESGLEAVLRSEFFRSVREISAKETAHHGGCTLFLHEDEVSSI